MNRPDTPEPGRDPLMQGDEALIASCLRMLHGELDADEAEDLARHLEASADLRRLFVKLAVQTQLVSEALARQAEGVTLVDAEEDPYAGDIMAELVDAAVKERNNAGLLDELAQQEAAENARKRRYELRRRAESEPTKRVVVIPKAIVWLGLAAVLGLVVWIGNLAMPARPVEMVDSAEPAEPRVSQPTPAPQAPAQLLATHRAVWSSDSGPVGVDGSLSAGEYGLDAGYLHIAMGAGVTVILEGPASFSIDSASRVSLATGVLSAYVPEGAEGFIVDTPAGRVLDLGTEFGVEVLGDETVEVHVMDGEVVAALANGSDSRSMRVGDAGRMGRTAERIEPVIVHTEKFARDWGQVERAVRVEGAARFLYETPGSLRQGAIENDDLFYVLPERRGVAIDQGFACDFTRPGTYDRMPNADTGVTLLPEDTRVDSFLLHYDRVGTPQELVAVKGVIHFDRPVVGIIVDDRRLMATDAIFLDHRVQYPIATDVTRGLEGKEHQSNPGVLQDVVELSTDRMTLTVHLETSTGIDQLRVLVEAEPGGAADN